MGERYLNGQEVILSKILGFEKPIQLCRIGKRSQFPFEKGKVSIKLNTRFDRLIRVTVGVRLCGGGTENISSRRSVGFHLFSFQIF